VWLHRVLKRFTAAEHFPLQKYHTSISHDFASYVFLNDKLATPGVLKELNYLPLGEIAPELTLPRELIHRLVDAVK
jgi:hypothetical protein